jgi:hypothetical protein
VTHKPRSTPLLPADSVASPPFEVTELLHGQSASEFDWEVKAVRLGYEDYKVIRPAGQLGGQPAPQAAR